MLTVIREITFDPGSSTLLFNPVKELSQLRGAILYNGTETLHKVSSSAQDIMPILLSCLSPQVQGILKPSDYL